MTAKLSNRILKKLGKGNGAEARSRALFKSVGFKIMVGVGLISNVCIGLLIYMNHMAFQAIDQQTAELLEINASMNGELRESIFTLQKKYLEIPKKLQVDALQDINNWISKNYTIKHKELIKGRNNYKSLFNRSQRRDISKGNFVVQADKQNVILSKGQMDNDGRFLDMVDRVYINASNPASQAQAIIRFIADATKAPENTSALTAKVLELKSLLADEAIHAEKARNAILYMVEELEEKKAGLIRFSKEKQNMVRLMAVIAVALNLLLLHFITWFVVEKPLKRLIKAIERINQAESVEIPYQNRKDSIGILAGTLKNFQRLLAHLKKEDRRKREEKQIIQALIEKMTGLIEHIQKNAHKMKSNAVELSILATATENHTTTATQSASRTVEQTRTVSSSTRQLQSAVEDIGTQISKQNALVGDINAATKLSCEDMKRLNQATSEINDIVNIVKSIAGKTKLLALNARIEAARSGEAGKGFTVIAKEVSELSLQTESANEEITQKISSIQQAGRTIITNTQEVDTRVARLLEASQQISAALEQQSEVTQGIAHNAHSTATDIKDVNDRIEEVKEAARETSRFAGDVKSYSERIASQLSELLSDTRQKLVNIGSTDSGQDFNEQLSKQGMNSDNPAPVTSQQALPARQYAA